jgi:hypothetical protein
MECTALGQTQGAFHAIAMAKVSKSIIFSAKKFEVLCKPVTKSKPKIKACQL